MSKYVAIELLCIVKLLLMPAVRNASCKILWWDKPISDSSNYRRPVGSSVFFPTQWYYGVDDSERHRQREFRKCYCPKKILNKRKYSASLQMIKFKDALHHGGVELVSINGVVGK